MLSTCVYFCLCFLQTCCADCSVPFFLSFPHVFSYLYTCVVKFMNGLIVLNGTNEENEVVHPDFTEESHTGNNLLAVVGGAA